MLAMNDSVVVSDQDVVLKKTWCKKHNKLFIFTSQLPFNALVRMRACKKLHVTYDRQPCYNIIIMSICRSVRLEG